MMDDMTFTYNVFSSPGLPGPDGGKTECKKPVIERVISPGKISR